jgi:molybdopterin-binding protein
MFCNTSRSSKPVPHHLITKPMVQKWKSEAFKMPWMNLCTEQQPCMTSTEYYAMCIIVQCPQKRKEYNTIVKCFFKYLKPGTLTNKDTAFLMSLNYIQRRRGILNTCSRCSKYDKMLKKNFIVSQFVFRFWTKIFQISARNIITGLISARNIITGQMLARNIITGQMLARNIITGPITASNIMTVLEFSKL